MTYPKTLIEITVPHGLMRWCDGGEIKLDNLLLLCIHHHTLMHEGGFKLKPANDTNSRFYFARPDGRPIEPAQVASSAEDEIESGQHGI